MLGGYQILDLRGIDLTISQSASDITNANVLNQLLKLRDYIDKAYNFSKPLENQLKPVLIRFRDKKANEKIEGATFGELSVVDNYYSFKITARLSGVLVLTINVTFEEVENGYGNYEWVIDDATIQLADETQTISGDLEVTGDASVGGILTVTDDLSVGDDVAITGDLSVGGDAEVTGDLEVTGDFSAPYEEIGNLDAELTWLNGLTATNVYGKCIKENNILYFVFSCRLVNETEAEISTLKNTGITSISNLDASISSKVFRKDGTNCSQAVVSGDNITGLHGFVSQANAGVLNDILCSCYSSSPNAIGFWAGNDDANKITVPAGESKDFDLRLFIIL